MMGKRQLTPSAHGIAGRRATVSEPAAANASAVSECASAEMLAHEIAGLPADALLEESRDLSVYLAEARHIPEVLQEIGRLREVTFRAAGEGTGESVDIDRFDDHYLHLFVWNREKREVVGAYRLGNVQSIVARMGRKGLYTDSLFKFSPRFLSGLGPALELGRSFIRPEYQKLFAPLLLLWKGIGAYVARHPEY